MAEDLDRVVDQVSDRISGIVSKKRDTPIQFGRAFHVRS